MARYSSYRHKSTFLHCNTATHKRKVAQLKGKLIEPRKPGVSVEDPEVSPLAAVTSCLSPSVVFLGGFVVSSGLIELSVAISSRHRCGACLPASGWPGFITPPPPGSFRNHHTMPFSSSRGSKAWSGGTLVTGNYQLAQMKWLLERPLKTHRATRSLRHPLAIHLIPPPLSRSRSCLFEKKKIIKQRMKCISRSSSFASSFFRPAR